MWKIIKCNILLHCIPHILIVLINYWFPIFNFGFRIVYYLLTLISTFIHILYYIDLINASCTSVKESKLSQINLISLTIILNLYQTIIYLITRIICFILHEKLYIISFSINFMILLIYHSFYCYNNLWQSKKMMLGNRISMFENQWAYYFGFGVFITILYSNHHPFCVALYNIYMCFLIIIPFYTIIKPIPEKYPKIDLSIFSWILGKTFIFGKYCYEGIELGIELIDSVKK